MCLAILRYITDHIKYLPLYIIHNMIVENDFFFSIGSSDRIKTLDEKLRWY